MDEITVKVKILNMEELEITRIAIGTMVFTRCLNETYGGTYGEKKVIPQTIVKQTTKIEAIDSGELIDYTSGVPIHEKILDEVFTAVGNPTNSSYLSMEVTKPILRKYLPYVKDVSVRVRANAYIRHIREHKPLHPKSKISQEIFDKVESSTSSLILPRGKGRPITKNGKEISFRHIKIYSNIVKLVKDYLKTKNFMVIDSSLLKVKHVSKNLKTEISELVKSYYPNYNDKSLRLLSGAYLSYIVGDIEPRYKRSKVNSWSWNEQIEKQKKIENLQQIAVKKENERNKIAFKCKGVYHGAVVTKEEYNNILKAVKYLNSDVETTLESSPDGILKTLRNNLNVNISKYKVNACLYGMVDRAILYKNKKDSGNGYLYHLNPNLL